MLRKKNVGFNYLHRHPQTETSLNADAEHVIIDRKEWEEVIDYFHQYPKEVEKLGKVRYNELLTPPLVIPDVSNHVCFGCIHDCYGGIFAKECIGCNNGSNNKQT